VSVAALLAVAGMASTSPMIMGCSSPSESHGSSGGGGLDAILSDSAGATDGGGASSGGRVDSSGSSGGSSGSDAASGSDSSSGICPTTVYAPCPEAECVYVHPTCGQAGYPGTVAFPERRIEDALGRGKPILLAPGAYDGPVSLPPATQLVGPPAAEAGAAPTAALDSQLIVDGAGERKVAGLRVRGPLAGVFVMGGARLVCARLHVDGATMSGSASDVGGVGVVVSDSELHASALSVTANAGVGLRVTGDSRVTIAPPTIKADDPTAIIWPEIMPSSISGNGQGGVSIIWPEISPKPPEVTLDGVDISGNKGIGVHAAGHGRLRVLRSRVQANYRPDAPSQYGYGILVTETTGKGPPQLEVRDTLVRDHPSTGVLARGAWSVTVAGDMAGMPAAIKKVDRHGIIWPEIMPCAINGNGGGGVSIIWPEIVPKPAGAVGQHPSVNVSGVGISGNAGHGLRVIGRGTLDMQHSLIRGTKYKAGRGDGLFMELNKGPSPSAALKDVRLVDNQGWGAWLNGVVSVSVGASHKAKPRPADIPPTGIIWPEILPTEFARNGDGGLRVVWGPGGANTHSFVMADTGVIGNGNVGVELSGGGSASIDRSIILGKALGAVPTKGAVADGLRTVMGKAGGKTIDGDKVVTLGPDAVIAAMPGAGVVLKARTDLEALGVISHNDIGGLWLQQAQVHAEVGKTALIRANRRAGVVASQGAKLTVKGATIDHTAAGDAMKKGGVAVTLADGIGLFGGAKATLDGAQVQANTRCGVLLSGSADGAVSIGKSTLAGGVYGVAANTGTSLPGGVAQANNFAGQSVAALASAVTLVFSPSRCGTGDIGACLQLPGEKNPCTGKPDGVTCDDGNACTTGDRCEGGACFGTAGSTCECKQDSDCSGPAYECIVRKCLSNKCVEDSAPAGTACVASGCSNTGRCGDNGKCLPTSAACDDGDPCTIDQCLPGAKCKNHAVANGPCDDGVPCTDQTACKSGKCGGGVITCGCLLPQWLYTDAGEKKKADTPYWSYAGVENKLCATFANPADACDGRQYCSTSSFTCKLLPGTKKTDADCADAGKACTAGICDKDIGAETAGTCIIKPAQDGAPCDDGDLCTTPDTCKAGKCAGAQGICTCSKNADCAGQDDGLLCNGTLFCNLASGTCQVNPASVVTCPVGGNSPCRRKVCDGATGKCLAVPAGHVLKLPESGATVAMPYEVSQVGCEDGEFCTVGDTCVGTACEAGKPTKCACSKDAQCAGLDDNNPCNGTYFCDQVAGGCRLNPATVIACASTPCAAAACNTTTGKCGFTKIADGLPCDDGDSCTASDTCNAGVCQGKSSCACAKHADCAQGPGVDTCKVPMCAQGVCVVPPGGLACQDANACTVDSCSKGKCGHAPVPDGTATGAGKVCVAGAAVAVPAGVVLVPAGTYARGCNKGLDPTGCKAAEELPQARVQVAGVWLDRFEVSVARYRACGLAGKCTAPSSKTGCGYAAYVQAAGKAGSDAPWLGGLPVRCVSAAQAEAFCAFASKGGRLPTEDEWEKGARGGCALNLPGPCTKTTRTWPWPEAQAGSPVCSKAAVADSKRPLCGVTAPVPVALKHGDRSPYGANDMAGNVREWTATVWPKTPDSRAVRGGSFKLDGESARAARRGPEKAANSGLVDVGFRCVRPL